MTLYVVKGLFSQGLSVKKSNFGKCTYTYEYVRESSVNSKQSKINQNIILRLCVHSDTLKSLFLESFVSLRQSKKAVLELSLFRQHELLTDVLKTSKRDTILFRWLLHVFQISFKSFISLRCLDLSLQLRIRSCYKQSCS